LGKKKAPERDATKLIGAQTSANQASQKANALAGQQTNTFGSVTANLDDKGNVVGQTQDLNPLLGGAANDVLGTTAGYTGFLPQQQFTTAGAIQNQGGGVPVGQALFDRGMTYMRPQFEQQSRDMQTNLLNRGLPIGSEAWSDATSNLADSQNRALVDLSSRATLATPGEEQRLIGNELMQRNQGAADIRQNLGLLGSMQSLAPQFGGTATQAPVDAMGAYDREFQAKQKAVEQHNAGIGNAIKMGVGLLTAPVTGGLSAGLLGALGGSTALAAPTLLGTGINVAANMFNQPPAGYGSSWEAHTLYKPGG